MIKSICVLLSLACMNAGANAAELRTEHTYQLEEDESRPVATLADAHWLVGTWRGTGLGQSIEETWNPPSAGSMVGLFKLFGDDGVTLYEIMWIIVEDGVLSLKVKHFGADFTAWEEGKDHVNFRIVKVEENALHFGGLSFYRNGPDKIDGYIVMRNGDVVTEQHLQYTRLRLDD